MLSRVKENLLNGQRLRQTFYLSDRTWMHPDCVCCLRFDQRKHGPEVFSRLILYEFHISMRRVHRYHHDAEVEKGSRDFVSIPEGQNKQAAFDCQKLQMDLGKQNQSPCADRVSYEYARQYHPREQDQRPR